jgi:hypothetical protein
MKYRKLGGSGLKVSEISLGSWLTYGGYVERENAANSIHKAYSLGIKKTPRHRALNCLRMSWSGLSPLSIKGDESRGKTTIWENRNECQRAWFRRS